MHDIKWIRDHPQEFDRGLKRRGLDALAKRVMAIDETRRGAIVKLETAQAHRNAASKEIGQAKAEKDESRAQALMAEVAILKASSPELEAEAKRAEDELNNLLATIPNMPAD